MTRESPRDRATTYGGLGARIGARRREHSAATSCSACSARAGWAASTSPSDAGSRASSRSSRSNGSSRIWLTASSCARCSSTRRASPRGSSTRTSSRRTSSARSTATTSSAWSTCPARICRRSSPAARTAACRSTIAAALTQQAAQGLHYAHEARDGHGQPIGLVHRDVSPRNIFVTYHGVVKLLDFGVVRGPEKQKSIPGVFKGKYGYCAPEQIEGARDRSPHRRLLPGHRAVGVPDRRAPVRREHRRGDHRRRPLAADRAAQRAAPRGSAGARRDHAARAGARSGAALPERARHVRGARSLPDRAETAGRPARASGAGWRRSSAPSARR